MDTQSLIDALRMTHGPETPTGAQRVMQGGLPLAAATTNAAIPPGMVDAIERGLSPALQSRGMPTSVASMVDALWSPLNPHRAMPGPGELGITQPLRMWGDANLANRLNKLVNQGKSHSEIAQELGISKDAVSGRIRRLNNPTPDTPRKGEGYWTEQTEGQLKDLLDRGITYGDAAATMGISRGAVAGRARRLGLQEPTSLGTPSTPQLNFQQQPTPEADPEMAKIMTNYMRSMGVID